MRLRLYEIGSIGVGKVHRIDRFPVCLKPAQDGEILRMAESTQSGCLLEDSDGVIYFRALSDSAEIWVNDAHLECGSIEPGDRLQLGTRNYLVSYEKMATHVPGPTSYKMVY